LICKKLQQTNKQTTEPIRIIVSQTLCVGSQKGLTQSRKPGSHGPLFFLSFFAFCLSLISLLDKNRFLANEEIEPKQKAKGRYSLGPLQPSLAGRSGPKLGETSTKEKMPFLQFLPFFSL
jgi:hypothetical protein